MLASRRIDHWRIEKNAWKCYLIRARYLFVKDGAPLNFLSKTSSFLEPSWSWITFHRHDPKLTLTRCSSLCEFASLSSCSFQQEMVRMYMFSLQLNSFKNTIIYWHLILGRLFNRTLCISRAHTTIWSLEMSLETFLSINNVSSCS